MKTIAERNYDIWNNGDTTEEELKNLEEETKEKVLIFYEERLQILDEKDCKVTIDDLLFNLGYFFVHEVPSELEWEFKEFKKRFFIYMNERID